MSKILRMTLMVAAVGALAGGVVLAPNSAEARRNCQKKAGIGSAPTMAGAKFQVDEVLLQSVDWGAWAEWMATGNTSNYHFGPRKYRCKKGGMGYECYGTSTICQK